MLTEQEQEEASKSESWRIRADLAKNPALVERLQDVLAKDKDEGVRSYLARNPALVERLQDVLARDKKTIVRKFLAKNPALAERLHDILAKDKNVAVRYLLASNPALKLKPAVALYYDEEKNVVQNLKEYNIKLYEHIVALEKKALRDANMSFVGLASETQQRVVIKGLVGQTVSNL